MNDLPNHLQPEYIQKVFDINNAVMEVSLNCKVENADCLKCGNTECFKVFEDVAKFQRIPFNWLVIGCNKQRELDEKAAEAQAKRYEQYQREFEQREMISKIKKSESKERSLFDAAA